MALLSQNTLGFQNLYAGDRYRVQASSGCGVNVRKCSSLLYQSKRGFLGENNRRGDKNEVEGAHGTKRGAQKMWDRLTSMNAVREEMQSVAPVAFKKDTNSWDDHSESETNTEVRRLESRASDFSVSKVVPSSSELAGSSADQPNRALWIAAVAGVSLCWGMNFPVTKLITDSATSALTMTPGAFAALRFGISGVLMSPFLLQAEELPAVLLGGAEIALYLAIGYISQAMGLETEGAGTAGFLCSLQVVVVTVAAAIKERTISVQGALSAILAVSGVAVLEGVGNGGLQDITPGFLILMLQPFAFGFSYLRIEKLMKKFPKDTLPFVAAQLIFTAVFSLMFTEIFEGGSAPVAEAFKGLICDGFFSKQAMAVGYTAIFGTVISVALECQALKFVSPREASVVLTSEPLIASVGGAWLLREQFDGWLGAALIISACLVTFIKFDKGDDNNNSALLESKDD